MEGEQKPCIKAENVRNLLGELYVFCQRAATLDDVSMVEQWNASPLSVREFALQLALENLPKILEDTHKQANDRVAKILVVLETLRGLTSLEGEMIQADTPFDPPASDAQN